MEEAWLRHCMAQVTTTGLQSDASHQKRHTNNFRKCKTRQKNVKNDHKETQNAYKKVTNYHRMTLNDSKEEQIVTKWCKMTAKETQNFEKQCSLSHSGGILGACCSLIWPCLLAVQSMILSSYTFHIRNVRTSEAHLLMVHCAACFLALVGASLSIRWPWLTCLALLSLNSLSWWIEVLNSFH